MKNLLKTLSEKKVLCSDGAWGTMLQVNGLKPGDCPEEWNLTNSDIVYNIAKAYIEAGADMIKTNSFGASRIKLSHYGLESKTSLINKKAAEISREAAGDKFVIASIGPTGKILLIGDTSEEELYDNFKEQAVALQEGGADAACIETMSATDEAIIAVKAVKENTTLTCICTFTFEKTLQGDYKTMMGISPEEAALATVNAGADIIGTNCGNGTDNMIEIVKIIKNTCPDTPIIVHSNAGIPIQRDGKIIFPETPELMSAKIPLLISAGASIIGGCCGTTPEHIKLISHIIKSRKNY